MLKESLTLVPVPSMMANLRSLTLAVAAGSPVLLQGPVGCGKTSLVQHLAQRVGRDRAPDFMKIQLGDQTDSKVRERERGERGEKGERENLGLKENKYRGGRDKNRIWAKEREER